MISHLSPTACCYISRCSGWDVKWDIELKNIIWGRFSLCWAAHQQMFQMSTAGCVTAKPSHRQNVYHIRWTLFGRFFTWLRCSLQGPPDVWDVLRRICHSSKTFTKMFTSPLGCEVQQNIRAIATFAIWEELRCSHIESRMKCTLLSICHNDRTFTGVGWYVHQRTARDVRGLIYSLLDMFTFSNVHRRASRDVHRRAVKDVH